MIVKVRQKKPDLALPVGNRTCTSEDIKDMMNKIIASVTLENQEMVTAAIAGKQHLDGCGKMKAKEQTLTPVSPATSAPPDSSCDIPDKPLSNSTQTRWSCTLWVTVRGKLDLISHFQGRRHEDAVEKLKVKVETSKSRYLQWKHMLIQKTKKWQLQQ
ncbi:conserved hypothetical protein [Ricinus communis]|uniref:Uncharacterized protein n=1 Tax=Ricinus communis TaxID=3988 RepID=B9RX79_RICCO|nr:conserved hypothetical protein [Ricinus communis]